MALSVINNFISQKNSPPQYLGLSQQSYVRKIDPLPEGIILVVTHDTSSLIQIDESHIENMKLNGHTFIFKSNSHSVLLKENESLEIFFKKSVSFKQNTNAMQSVKLTHIDLVTCSRELGIA